jgi:hypothetical protein
MSTQLQVILMDQAILKAQLLERDVYTGVAAYMMLQHYAVMRSDGVKTLGMQSTFQ